MKQTSQHYDGALSDHQGSQSNDDHGMPITPKCPTERQAHLFKLD